jgi:hypothetical protein
MRATKTSLLTALTAALLLPVAADQALAQRGRPNISRVEIIVRDIGTREELGRIGPGGVISLPDGARVRLLMAAFPSGTGERPIYPTTEFTDLARGGTRIVRSTEENSTADLEIIRSRDNRKRSETLRYEIKEDWVPSKLRTGSFRIDVGPPTLNGGQIADSRARALTRTLYQGILLREPDRGADPTIDSIERGGYPALVRAAVAIAGSDESRIRLYEKEGVCNEKRLLAIYKNLLGVNADQVDRRQWDADLRRLNSGEITRVVSDIVNSDRFRSRHNIAVARN